MKKHLESTKNYFKEKAKDYDLVDKQLYWNLSDTLLWYSLKKLVLNKLKGKEVTFLDAGGGTGRWTIRITKYLKCKTVLYDISEDMIEIARTNATKAKIANRIDFINGDIENMKVLDDESFDLVINTHNVLGFVKNPKNALKEMIRVLKSKGFLVSFIPNKYHALYFNILTNKINDLDIILKKNVGRFTDNMPLINLFTPSSIRELYKLYGLRNIFVTGFPITIYPNIEETRIKGSNKTIKNILSKHFKLIEKIEKSIILNEEVTSRGNNIFAIGQKP